MGLTNTASVLRRRSERRREDELSSWFKASPDPLFMLDERGCLLRCNEAARRSCLGDLRVGQPIHAAMATEWQLQAQKAITRCSRERRPLQVELGESPLGVVLLLLRPFERISDDLLLAQLVTVANQRALRTERIARRRAEKASAAKSSFLANMSHEIRTPLGGVIGYTDLLVRNPEHPERRGWAHQAHRCASHLLALLNGILDLSKIEAGELKLELAEVDPSEILDEVEAAMRPVAAKRRVELSCEFLGEWSTIETDALRLRQVLINLTQNAIKFAPDGSVDVTCRVVPAPRGRRVQIEVRDDGCGIPADKLEDVFKPFTQLEDQRGRAQIEGTGLGLQITRQLVRLLGGTIEVASQVGVGTLFTISLPAGSMGRASAERKRQSAGTGKVAPPDLRGVEILVADDDDSSRDLTRIRLEALGAKVDAAADGAEALESALARPYQLIFMDMRMPILDGYAATRALRKRGVQTPIVALTAHAMTGDRDRCRKAGCSDYVTKPIEQSSLYACLRRQLAGAGDEAPLVGEDPVQALVRSYAAKLPGRGDELEQLVRRRDRDAVHEHAHRLAGSAGAYGYKEVGRLAALVDRALRGGASLDELEDRLAELTLCMRSSRRAA
ncbi:MAG TPA: hypothetical protein DEA08_22870 [Planctomycetes bacterium]|nr:hypothetical protein [Planctomycetota bacterium]